MSLVDKIFDRFNITSNKTKIIKNIYWAVVGKTVTLLGTLLVGILVARYLGPEQYGVMNYVVSYVSLFQILASFGMDNIEVRELSKHNVSRDVIMGTAFRLKLIFAIITVVLVIVTAFLFESDKFTIAMISIYSLSIILNRFSVIKNYFTSIVWNEYIVKSEILRTCVSAVIKVILLFLKAPLWAFVCVLTFDFVLLSAGYVYAYKNKVDSISKWCFDKNVAKYFIKQSYPLLLSGAAVIVYQRIDQVMIGNILDKKSVGMFSVASKFVEILIFMPTIIAQSITPTLIRIREKSLDEYHDKSQIFMSVTIWFCLFISLITCVCSHRIVVCTFGYEFLNSVPILQILSFKAVSVAISSTAGQIIIIENLQKYTIWRDVLGCFVCVILNAILLPKIGVKGAAFTAFISNISAGYFSDILIPCYRHIFKKQTCAILWGWKCLFSSLKSIL